MNIDAEFQRLEEQLRTVEALLTESEEKLGRRAPRVSAWSVAEQIDHLGKVLERSLEHLLTGAAPLPKGINLTGRIILGCGRIPRGVGKSPKAVLPSAGSSAALREAVARIRPLVGRLRARPASLADRRPVFPHPYFGNLSAAQTVRFLTVHTGHHLRIIADIRRATGA